MLVSPTYEELLGQLGKHRAMKHLQELEVAALGKLLADMKAEYESKVLKNRGKYGFPTCANACTDVESWEKAYGKSDLKGVLHKIAKKAKKSKK